MFDPNGTDALESFANKIEGLIEFGWNLREWVDYSSWAKRVGAFLSVAVDEAAAERFGSLTARYEFEWRRAREEQIGHLEGLALKVEARGLAQAPEKDRTAPEIRAKSRKVFVVHGHDNEAKEQVARFLERIGLEPIVLHEQPNSGQTIIEKFEVYADVSFAVVLLTPDDVGSPASNPSASKPRARQNVILELGYFMGKLSRQRVCALYKHGVEMPSDYQGVLYVEMDAAGAWKTKLAQELVHVGLNIDLQALLRA
jgi:predicted nucleotide-binding protein